MESLKEGRTSSPLRFTQHQRNENQAKVAQNDSMKARAESCLSFLLDFCPCKAGASSASSVLFLTTADSRIDGSSVMATLYCYVILEVSLQRHKTRGHSEQPLELVFLMLDQCGGALAAVG